MNKDAGEGRIISTDPDALAETTARLTKAMISLGLAILCGWYAVKADRILRGNRFCTGTGGQKDKM